MAFKANHNSARNGAWIGNTDIWNDPRATLDDSSYDGFFVPAETKPKYLTDTRPATPAQLKFMKDLFAQRSNNVEARALRIGALSVYRDGRMTVTAASDFITVIKRIPRDLI